MTYEDIVTALRAAGCVFAEDEARLLMSSAQTSARLTDLVSARIGGLPLEHVLGWAEFHGLRIEVDPGVFVPRRRTEFLVDRAAALTAPGALVVDLCCGSGALGVALASVVDIGELHAADVDPAAVACARRNVATVGGHAHQGDLFAALPGSLRGRVGTLLSNVPYVPTGEIATMPPEARDHEAPVALDGGADGLNVLRRVAAEAPAWLATGGHVLVETSRRQASVAEKVFTGNGFAATVEYSDDYDATVVIGTHRP